VNLLLKSNLTIKQMTAIIKRLNEENPPFLRMDSCEPLYALSTFQVDDSPPSTSTLDSHQEQTNNGGSDSAELASTPLTPWQIAQIKAMVSATTSPLKNELRKVLDNLIHLTLLIPKANSPLDAKIYHVA
jgi:hypothetical protein